MAKKRTTKSADTVDKMVNFRVLVDAPLDRLKSLFHTYRLMARKIVSTALTYGSVALEPDLEVRTRVIGEAEQAKKDAKRAEAAAKRAAKAKAGAKSKKKGEVREIVKAVAFNQTAAKELTAAILKGRDGGSRLYCMRNFFFTEVAKFRDIHGFELGSHIWDTLKVQLEAGLKTKMPDYGEATREWLIYMNVIEPPSFKGLGIPFLRWVPPAGKGRVYASAIEDERGKRFILELAKGQTLEAIVEGSITVPDANGGEPKVYSLKPNFGHKYLFHKFAAGELQWATPTLNFRQSRHGKPEFTLSVPFKKRIQANKDLDAARSLEVTAMPIYGRDLPRSKRQTHTNDDKLYILHAMRDSETAQWPVRIAVNDVVADMLRYSREAAAIELQRDCRRRGWKRKQRRPLQDRINAVTKKRVRRQQDANHVWSRQLVDLAQNYSCGTIKLFGVPDGAKEGLTFDGTIPWQWFQFTAFLKYKAKERGINVVVVESENSIATIRARMSRSVEEDADEEVKAVAN